MTRKLDSTAKEKYTAIARKVESEGAQAIYELLAYAVDLETESQSIIDKQARVISAFLAVAELAKEKS